MRERAPEGGDLIIDFTECTDGSGTTHGDLALTLIGDWPEPSLGDTRPLRVRYVQRPGAMGLDRWIIVERGTLFRVPLLAIDASSLFPTVGESAYGPIGLSLVPTECGPVEHPAGCGPLNRLVVRATFDGGESSVIDGTAAFLTSEPLHYEGYRVVVAQAVELGTSSCPDASERRLVIAIAGHPFS
jgi:hypothetical protein